MISYEDAKEKLFVKVQNASKASKDVLSTELADDLVMTYHIRVDNEELEDAVISMEINDKCIEAWSVSKQQLHNDALASTEQMFPLRMGTLGSMVGENDTEDVFVVTNEKAYCGAAALFYPGTMKGLFAKLGRFFVLPSSVHEVIVLPADGGGADELRKMVCNVNQAVVAPKDWLSDDVYLYDSAKHILTVAR